MIHPSFWSLLIAALFAATPTRAEPFSVRLEALRSEQTCGAALIAPDTFVTAGHCLASNVRGGRMVRAPVADGTAPIRQSARHPFFETSPPGAARLPYDVALGTLRLNGRLRPAPILPVGEVPVAGEVLTVETWLRSEERPSRRDCPVLQAGRIVTLGCSAVSGHSGAPVLRMTPDGPELVAVLVAHQPVAGGGRALAAPLAPRIGTLREGIGQL